MPIYIFVGPAVALIGIVAVVFVMRHKSVQTRSMYSSRRSQFERKVKAARQRTLAPRGRGDRAPTDAEIAATTVEEAPAAMPRQAWDVGPTSAQTFPAAAPPPEPSTTVEPTTPTPAEPAWSPSPVEPPSWTPAPRPASDYTAPSTPASPAPTQAEPVTPAGGGAAWSIVGESKSAAEDVPAAKDKEKDKKKAKQAVATGNAWELASGNAPGDGEAVEVKAPSAAMAVAQYAVLVVGLVMVLIGVLVMVANQKGT